MIGCDQVEDFLAAADSAARRRPSEEVRAHLEKCPPCRRLWEFSCASDPADVPSETRACIEQQLKSSLHPVRPLPAGRTRALIFFTIFLAGSVVWLLRTGLGGAYGMDAIQLAGTLSAVAAAAALAAVVLSGEMVPGEKRMAPIGFVALVAVGGIAALIALLFPWESSGSSWLAAAMKCHTHGAMFAIPTAAIAVLALRRGAPLCPGTAGAAIGLLAGLAGMAALHFGCSMHGALHITIGHLSVPAGGALIGYLAGKAVGRWSANAGKRSIEA